MIALAVLAGIALLDQCTKWWAWRYMSGARINYSGDLIVPASVNSLYAHPVSGALLDLLDSGVLIAAGAVLLRRPRSLAILIPGTLILGGWASNLLDRLILHYWTAPGSVRGVVDFLPLGQHRVNIADLLIVLGTPLFLLASTGAFLQRLAVRRQLRVATAAPKVRPRRLAREVMVAVAVPVILTLIVGFGAANFGGQTAPASAATTTNAPTLVTRHGIFYESP